MGVHNVEEFSKLDQILSQSKLEAESKCPDSQQKKRWYSRNNFWTL